MTQIANNIVKFFSEKWPILAIAVVAIVFCFLLYKWLFTPRKSTVQSNSEKNRKRIDKGISYKENQKALQAKIDIAKFWGKLPLVSFTEEDKEELQKLILAVTSIEESNLALRTSKKLNCKKTVTTGELGSFEYSLIKNIEALDYTNAYRVSISVTANTGESISQEVILYAQE